jgi:hypothetical protein
MSTENPSDTTATGTTRGRDRFFDALFHVGTQRRGLLMVVVIGLLVASAVLVKDLQIRTSRYGLVDADNAYQSRLLRFFDRFGYPDAPIFVVRGGDEEARRATVDTITTELSADPEFTGRIFGKLDASVIADVLLLQQPEAITELRKSLGPDVDVVESIEAGLPGLFRALEGQLLHGLDEGVEGGDVDIDEGMDRLRVVAEVLDTRLQGGDLGPALEMLVDSEESEEDVRPQTLPVDDRGYLTSNSGDRLLLAVFPDFPDDDLETYEGVVVKLRAIQARAESHGTEVLLSGMPVLVVDDNHAVRSALLRSGLATGGGIFLLLLLSYRSFRTTIVALVPLGIGVGLSAGAMMVIYGYVNPITSSFLAVMLGLGIDISVHLVSRYHEERRREVPRLDSIRSALRTAGPGIVTGVVTTVLAFLTLSQAEFTAYGELGVITAVGLVITFLITLTVLPALLSVPRLSGSTRSPPFPGIGLALGMVERAPMVFVVVGLAAAIAGASTFSSVRFNGRYFDLMPEKLESAQAVSELERDGALSPMFAFASAPGIEESRALAAKLRALDTVGAVQSVSDLVPALDEDDRLGKLRASFAGLRDPDFDKLENRARTRDEVVRACTGVIDALDEIKYALEQADKSTKSADGAIEAFTTARKTLKALPEDGGPSLASLERQLADVLGRAWRTAARVAARGHYVIEDVPELFRRRHLAIDGSGAVSLFIYPNGDVYDRDYSGRLSQQVEALDPEAGGHAISMFRHNEMIIRDFRAAALTAAAIVIVILLLDLRRLSDALLAFTPTALGWCWMIGLFTLTGIEFTVANLVVLPLTMGIGVDAGAHVVHRARQSAAKHGVARLGDLFTGTGTAVVISSLTTMVGFAGLTVVDHRGMIGLGLAMVIGIACTFTAAMLTLPAALILLGRAGRGD